MIKVAFLIGNGTSREGLDLELFRNKGTIIGCNALHRDFTPDTLMAVDQKMIDEIGRSKYIEDNYFIIPNNRRKGKQYKNTYQVPIKKFNTCGCAIMHYAALIETDLAYLIGFDCYGQNVYIGTPAYGKRFNENRYRSFVKFYEETIQMSPQTKYINVIKDKRDGITPKMQRKHKNYGTVDMNLLLKNLNRFPYQEPIFYHDEYSISNR